MLYGPSYATHEMRKQTDSKCFLLQVVESSSEHIFLQCAMKRRTNRQSSWSVEVVAAAVGEQILNVCGYRCLRAMQLSCQFSNMCVSGEASGHPLLVCVPCSELSWNVGKRLERLSNEDGWKGAGFPLLQRCASIFKPDTHCHWIPRRMRLKSKRNKTNKCFVRLSDEVGRSIFLECPRCPSYLKSVGKDGTCIRSRTRVRDGEFSGVLISRRIILAKLVHNQKLF